MSKSQIRPVPIRSGNPKSAIRNRSLLFTSAVCLLTFYFSCERNTTPFTQTSAKLTLSAEYVAVTDAWLQVQTKNISGVQQLKVWHDTTIVFNGILNTTDTTIYDSALLPAHDYTYHAAIVKNGEALVKSPPLKITTMDTTSHDFTWELFTFGTGGSSILWDVAIISPDNIWAVGKIYADTAQPWLPYNAVHWDGQQWELKRILYQGGFWEINNIFAFSATDIWFDTAIKWNGVNFIEMPIPGILIGHSINKMWGTSSSDLYVVGSEGLIAHYNGGSWQKIESGTDDIINDIYGIQHTQESTKKILCAVGDTYSAPNGYLLSIQPDLTINIYPWLNHIKIHSVWMENNYLTYACGDGIWKHNGTTWKEFENVTGAFWDRIRGNSVNDIFTCGDFGFVAHFNGLTWQSYRVIDDGILFSLDVERDLVAVVGFDGAIGYAIVGKRNY